MKPQMSSSNVTTSITRMPFAAAARNASLRVRSPGPNQRFAEVGAGGAGDADAGELDAAVSDDEVEQPAREPCWPVNAKMAPSDRPFVPIR